MFQAKGVPDGHDPFSYLDIIGIAELDNGQVAIRFDFDESQISIGITPFNFRIKLPIVLQDHLDFVGALHHVIIGNNVTVMIDNKTGTQTPLFESLVGTAPKKFLKKVVKGVIFFKGSALEMRIYVHGPFAVFFRTDVDYGRTVFFGQFRKTFRHPNDMPLILCG